jgi:hypothetical protein
MKATVTFTAEDQDFEEGSAAPVSGTYEKGDRIWNTNPQPGENIGWVCTEAGSPGTWKPFGVIGL